MADPDFKQKIESTMEILHEIGCHESPRILVFNKIDLIKPPSKLPAIVRSIYKHSLCVSGFSGQGIDEFRETVHEWFSRKWNSHEINLEYSQANLLSHIYDAARVESVEYKPEHILVKFKCSEAEYGKLQNAFQAAIEKDIA